MAADSRLRGAFVWDQCPKLLPLPRNDCALCFAGTTAIAYPFMIQIHSAVKQYDRALNRSLDLVEFKGKVLDIINGMRKSMHSFPVPPQPKDEEETYLILGGYSWRFSEFKIWTLHYDTSIDGFTFRPAAVWDGIDGERMLAIVGDHLKEAKEKLVALLEAKGKRSVGGFDMEPFEMLRDMIRLGSFPEIGGSPQILKVYRHMNCTPIAVYWPSRSEKKVTLLGRELLSYERPEVGILDPDALEIA